MEQWDQEPAMESDDDAAMDVLRRDFNRGADDDKYLLVVRAWATEHASTEYDLAPEEAKQLALAALDEAESVAVVYTLSWPELKAHITAFMLAQLANTASVQGFGWGDERAIERLLSVGARQVTSLNSEDREEAVHNAMTSIIQQSWYKARQRMPEAFFVTSGRNRAISIWRKNKSRQALIEVLVGIAGSSSTQAKDEEATKREAEGILDREMLAGVKTEARNRIISLQRAHSYCLYDPIDCVHYSSLLDYSLDAIARLSSLEECWLLLQTYVDRHRPAHGKDRKKLSRDVAACSEFRAYTLFVRTAADRAWSARESYDDNDGLRLFVVKRWRMQRDGKTWDYTTSPVKQVKRLVSEDRLFGPTLLRAKPDVAKFLRLEASTLEEADRA